jgi:hypothetical protein
MRSCLKCGYSFSSKHKFNRLCENCLRQNAEINYEVYAFNGRATSRRLMTSWQNSSLEPPFLHFPQAWGDANRSPFCPLPPGPSCM